jgi:hypothetical protein
VSSSDYRYKQMIDILERCLHQALVFTRDVPNKSLVETDFSRDKDGIMWAILAAGISADVATRVFRARTDKATQATVPLTVAGGGRASILLQIRPVEWPNPQPAATRFVAHFAPGEKLPLVEVLKGHINIDLPDNDLGIFNIRWEVDPANSGGQPREDWLNDWWRTLAFNPSHPPSHLHFNSRPNRAAADRTEVWEEPAENDLRLAIGSPNPLAFLLSASGWLRRIVKIR